jgi:hypothetical protein
MSIWSDVTHSPHRAQEAIDELERVAAHLEGLTESRAELAREALIDWHGARRDEVEQRLTELVERSGELVVQLRRAAVRIAEETDLADATQQRRERLRETITRPKVEALR